MRLPAVIFLPALVSASETDAPLQARLVSESTAVVPGKPFRLGLHLVHPPGAHTYWKHPGIVGLPTTLKWELPAGFTAGGIQWPAPRMVKMGSHDAQGYEGETLLILPVIPPATLSGGKITLSAKASWMCCGKTCSPANDVPLSITLPVADSARPDPVTRPLFEKATASLPEPAAAWKVSATRGRGNITLHLTPPPDIFTSGSPSAIRFFTGDGQIDTDKAQTGVLAGGEWRLEIATSDSGPATPSTLPGVLEVPLGGSRKYFEINPAYQASAAP